MIEDQSNVRDVAPRAAAPHTRERASLKFRAGSQGTLYVRKRTFHHHITLPI